MRDAEGVQAVGEGPGEGGVDVRRETVAAVVPPQVPQPVEDLRRDGAGGGGAFEDPGAGVGKLEMRVAQGDGKTCRDSRTSW